MRQERTAQKIIPFLGVLLGVVLVGMIIYFLHYSNQFRASPVIGGWVSTQIPGYDAEPCLLRSLDFYKDTVIVETIDGDTFTCHYHTVRVNAVDESIVIEDYPGLGELHLWYSVQPFLHVHGRHDVNTPLDGTYAYAG